jgi:uncharacterized delta-60 repeat protein
MHTYHISRAYKRVNDGSDVCIVDSFVPIDGSPGCIFAYIVPTGGVKIYRFNPDGSHDVSRQFAVEEGMFLFALAVQSDGKLILGGVFTRLGDYPAKYLVRLNADLSIDNTWKAGVEAKLNNAGDKIVSQPDGKIIIKGAFNLINNGPSSGYVRLNADGSIDTSFTLDLDKNERATAVALQADGKIVVGFPGRIARYTLPLEQTITFAGIPDKLISDVPFKLI